MIIIKPGDELYQTCFQMGKHKRLQQLYEHLFPGMRILAILLCALIFIIQ